MQERAANDMSYSDKKKEDNDNIPIIIIRIVYYNNYKSNHRVCRWVKRERNKK